MDSTDILKKLQKCIRLKKTFYKKVKLKMFYTGFKTIELIKKFAIIN